MLPRSDEQEVVLAVGMQAVVQAIVVAMVDVLVGA
jgi:hypothetical protein